MGGVARSSRRIPTSALIATAAAVLIAGCGGHASTAATGSPASLDLKSMWESAAVCPDYPDAHLPTVFTEGDIQKQYQVSEDHVLGKLAGIHVDPKSEAAARTDISRLKTGFEWLRWTLGVHQQNIQLGPYTEPRETQEMAAAQKYFLSAQETIDGALGAGETVGPTVGSTFDEVCLG